MPSRHAFRLLGLLPLLIPPRLHAIVWSRLLASSPLDPFSIPGVVMVLGLAYFPFVVLLTSAGLRAIDPAMEDAARPRAGPPRMLVAVTLSLVRRQLLAAALLVYVFAIIDFGVPDLLAESREIEHALRELTRDVAPGDAVEACLTHFFGLIAREAN